MDWKTDYLQQDGIVRVKMLNPVNLEGTKQICVEANALARKNQSHKYLIDHRGVDVILSAADIEKIPDAFREIGADFEGKTAILLDADTEAAERFQILKNVLAKAWMHFELFTDEQNALDWLKTI